MRISTCAFLWLKSHWGEGWSARPQKVLQEIARITGSTGSANGKTWSHGLSVCSRVIRNWSSYRHHPLSAQGEEMLWQVFQSRSYSSACKVSSSAWHRICLGTFPSSLFLNVALEKDWIIAQNVIELDRIVTLTFNWQAGPTQHTHRISCKTLCWAFLQISLQLSSPRPVNYNSLLNPTIPELLEHVPRTLLCKTRVTLLYNI